MLKKASSTSPSPGVRHPGGAFIPGTYRRSNHQPVDGNESAETGKQKNGSWHYETSDPQGNILFQAHGVFHEFIPNKKIVRTFQMMHENFDVQLEFLDFEALTEETSKLTMYFVYKSEGHRAEQLKLPFKQGLNWAHDALEKVAKQLKPAR